VGRGAHFWRAAVAAAICIIGTVSLLRARPQDLDQPRFGFEARLAIPLKEYDSGGQPFTQAFISLVYEYHLPASLEYVSWDAAMKPLNARLRNTTVRDALTALAAQLPEYRISFSSGQVEAYSPEARSDPSSMLNVIIRDFSANQADPMRASVDLFGALSATLHPDWGYGSSFAPLGGPKKITLHLQGAKVYEILNAIVAQHGDAIWVVRVPPQRLSTFQGDLWHLYSLDPHWRHVVLEDVQSLFPSKELTPP